MMPSSYHLNSALTTTHVSYRHLGSNMSWQDKKREPGLKLISIPETIPEVSGEIKSEIMSFLPVGN